MVELQLYIVSICILCGLVGMLGGFKKGYENGSSILYRKGTNLVNSIIFVHGRHENDQYDLIIVVSPETGERRFIKFNNNSVKPNIFEMLMNSTI